jgi:OOP family OmpA-OmpF porin
MTDWRSSLLVLLAVTLMQGCATPERIILLPQPDGTPSAVVVESKGRSVVLDQPYTVAEVSGRSIEKQVTDAASVEVRYKAVSEALPPRPRSFVLHYEFGTTKLTAQSRGQIDEMLDEIKRLPAPEIIIIGHTDQIGADSVNDALSLRRAEAVAQLLKARGIDPRSIETVGRGKREILVKGRAGVPEEKNRRVEIRIK